jgi:hypothetical protein
LCAHGDVDGGEPLAVCLFDAEKVHVEEWVVGLESVDHGGDGWR